MVRPRDPHGRGGGDWHRKVISEHATVGIVITTDGTITEIPREDYLEAEDRAIRELQAIGKPFVVLVNSAEPGSTEAAAIAKELAAKIRCQMLASELSAA